MCHHDTALFDYFEQHPDQSLEACTQSAPAQHNPCTPPATPSDHARRVAGVLRFCVGSDHAMTAPAIARAARLFDTLSAASAGTKVRRIIRREYEHMLLSGHVLIASSRGYYHTADADDLSHYDATMRSRIREDAIRLRRVRTAARIAGFMHQGRGIWTS